MTIKRLHFISLPSKPDLSGTTELGTINATLDDLRDAMGEPNIPPEGVEIHWIREVDDQLVIVTSTLVTDEWSVAGRDEVALQYLIEALAERKLEGF